jgi:3-phenylpropionate/cinnamic acid dioxygenase small subunit
MSTTYTTIASLAARIQLLEDKEAIQRLLNRYCSTADDRAWDQFAACFTADGVLGFDAWGGDVQGPYQIAATARSAEDRLDGLQHSMTNMEVTVDGDEGTCRCYLWFAATKGDTGGPREYQAFGGHYRFDVRRTGDGWRISRMQLKKGWAQDEDTERVLGSSVRGVEG